ncbi:MAG: hypothetical protein AMXMBFR84_24520 [Candidatus Hydrogenedentota bacterium]
MRKLATVMVFLVASLALAQDSFEDGFNRANALLRSGEADDALEAYRKLQIDQPELPSLYFGIGCAEFENALEKSRAQQGSSRDNVFSIAETAFEKAARTNDPALRRDAEFNLASASARKAIAAPEGASPDEMKARYKEGINAFERFLEKYPGHEGAEQSLDHLRYSMKRMLQQPPPEETQSGGNQEQEQNENDQQRGEQGKPSPKPGSQQGDSGEQTDEPGTSESQDEPQNDGEGEKSDGTDARPSPDENSQNMETPNIRPEDIAEREEDRTQNSDPRRAMTASAMPENGNRQEVEALLQSLEEIDKQEQLNLRRAPMDDRIRREWW